MSFASPLPGRVGPQVCQAASGPTKIFDGPPAYQQIAPRQPVAPLHHQAIALVPLSRDAGPGPAKPGRQLPQVPAPWPAGL